MNRLENHKKALVIDAFITAVNPDITAIALKLEMSLLRVNQIINNYLTE